MFNKVFRYVTISFSLIALFAIGNYYCYQSAMRHFEDMQEDYESRLGEQVHVYVSNEMAGQMDEIKTMVEEQVDDSVEVSQIGSTLNENTIFQIQTYDTLTDTTVTDYESLPDQLIGGEREAAEEYCRTYLKEMSPEEFLNGLQSVSVVSFSPERLIIRKNYDASKVKFKYYIISDGSEVVVYYGDMRTVYERTGIPVSKLTKKEKKALKKGIQVKDEEELYGILENYSS